MQDVLNPNSYDFFTYFDLAGTVGMERDYSWSFVPFQARLEWNESTRGRSFHSKLLVSILNFQATEQPTRTGNNAIGFCGGTAQLDPKTGVPSRGQRVLLTQRITFHGNIAQASEQAVLAIQVAPSGEV